MQTGLLKDKTRRRAWDAIKAAEDDVVRLAREMHADPELPYEEHRAAERIAAFLEARGFEVERGVAELPTAFRARAYEHDAEEMRKGLQHGRVGFVAEFDALPEIGHAHGHNLVTGAAVLAAIGLAATLPEVHGDVVVFGCPASHTYGGKNTMTKAGLFDWPDAVLGAHPAPPGQGYMYTIDSSGNHLAEARVRVELRGERDEAEAAALLAGTIEALRASAEEHDAVEVNDTAAGQLTLRALTRPRLLMIVEELRAELGAAGLGASVEIGELNDDMLVSRVLVRRVKTDGDNLGLRMDDIVKTPPGPPSDWGNVSYVVPAAQCSFPIPSGTAQLGDPGFMVAANTHPAYEQMAIMAQCLCLTGLDVLRDMTYRSIADAQLVKTLKARGIERPFRRWLGVHPVLPKAEGNGNKPKGPKLEGFRIVRGPEPRTDVQDD